MGQATLLASELYAQSQSAKCEGKERCHWCSAPCKRTWLHDDPPPIPFSKTRSIAKVPNSNYVCVGCWLYRRKSITIFYLSGEGKERYADRQTLREHSWLLMADGIRGIRHDVATDVQSMYQFLLAPTTRFALALKVGEKDHNHIQLAAVNNHDIIKADTPLVFTINGVPHTYTVYDLEMAVKTGLEGREPGVRELINLFGPPPVKHEDKEEENKRGRGRPTRDDEIKQMVRERDEIKSARRVVSK